MNCKPGDLAVVVSSALDKNIGLFVDVVGPYGVGDGPVIFADEHDLGVLWMCRARGKIAYESVDGDALDLREGPIPDCCLRPIRPGQKDVLLHEANEKKEHCVS